MRCVIVDDNEAFLQEARDLLQREQIEVVGVATTTAQALTTIAALAPDVALIDIDLRDESGFDLVEALAAAPGEAPRVVFISMHAECDFADLISASTAAGFVGKIELSARAIHEVLAR